MAKFEIIHAYPGQKISAKMPVAAVRGIAVEIDPADPESFRLAVAGGGFTGFLTNDVTTDGPAAIDHLLPGRLELPIKVGLEADAEKADAIEVEGIDLIKDSGTGAIDENTAAGTPVAFDNGKVYVKQAGDTARFLLQAQLTPEDDNNACRLRLEAIR